MGSTIGSVLQGVGSTGEDIGKADIANTQLQHQFTMDYLARQNASRQLDIAQKGQQQQFQLGQSAQDIERQRLAQSRWQLMPGYSKIPDPANPGKSLFRHTFLDPITKQQTFYDSNNPPPGSPEYNLSSFKYITDQANELGIDLPLNDRLAAAGMKVNTTEDLGTKYHLVWSKMVEAAKDDPAALAKLYKKYPGREADYIDQSIQNEHGGLSFQAHMDALMQGLTAAGQTRIPQYDKAYMTSLTASQKAYQDASNKADKDLEAAGITGKLFNTPAYQAATQAKQDAITNLAVTNQKLQDLATRMAGGQTESSTPNPPESPIDLSGHVVNPPVNQPPKVLSQAAIEQAAKDHNISVDEVKKQAIAAGYRIQVQ